MVETLLDEAVGVVYPSAQLVVVDGGVTRIAHAAGCSMTTRFDLASLTKPLCTTTLALRCIARGSLSLSDRPRPACTIEQLLAHASGLPGWRDLGSDAIDAAMREPLEYVPGTRSIYSDLGFILLGDAIERACDAKLDRLFAEISSTVTFGPLHQDVAPTEGEAGVVHDDNARRMGGVAGHAGLFGRAHDVATLVQRWVDAWHGDASLLDPALVRRAWSLAGVPGSTWGLGWDHPSATNSSAGALWPRDGVGHLGFTGCSIWIDPPRRRFVVLLTNRVHPTRANEAIKAFRPMIHDAIVRAL